MNSFYPSLIASLKLMFYVQVWFGTFKTSLSFSDAPGDEDARPESVLEAEAVTGTAVFSGLHVLFVRVCLCHI